jgi:pyruvate dehydrogenase E2 component (dihydrolipoamide acetyltransferase)
VKASAKALESMPEVNVRFSKEGLIINDFISIGVAVNVSDGLLVPVLNDVDQMTLHELSQSIHKMVVRTREGKLSSEDLGEKSMVVSNLGMEGVDAFIAIIDPPDPLILAVGRVAERVVPIEGEIKIQPMCTLTLSVDHRALDGVIGSRYLQCIKELLESPDRLLED